MAESSEIITSAGHKKGRLTMGKIISKFAGDSKGRALELETTEFMLDLQLGDIKNLLQQSIQDNNYKVFIYVWERSRYYQYKFVTRFLMSLPFTKERGMMIEYILKLNLITPFTPGVIQKWINQNDASLRLPILEEYWNLRNRIIPAGFLPLKELFPTEKEKLPIKSYFRQFLYDHRKFFLDVQPEPLYFPDYRRDLEFDMISVLNMDSKITRFTYEFLLMLQDYDNIAKVYEDHNVSTFHLSSSEVRIMIVCAQALSIRLYQFPEANVVPIIDHAAQIILGFPINLDKYGNWRRLSEMDVIPPELQNQPDENGKYWKLSPEEELFYRKIAYTITSPNCDRKNFWFDFCFRDIRSFRLLFPYFYPELLEGTMFPEKDGGGRIPQDMIIDFLPIMDSTTAPELFTLFFKEKITLITDLELCHFLFKNVRDPILLEKILDWQETSKETINQALSTTEYLPDIVFLDKLYSKGIIKYDLDATFGINDSSNWMIHEDFLYLMVTKYIDFSQLTFPILTEMVKRKILSPIVIMINTYQRKIFNVAGKDPDEEEKFRTKLASLTLFLESLNVNAQSMLSEDPFRYPRITKFGVSS